MEKEPKLEQGAERIPSKEEVLEMIGRSVENAQVIRELSDDKGLYLLEVKAEGKERGETFEFNYMRKGRHASNLQASETSIHVIYYQDEMPTGGKCVANYSEETGQWIEVQ